MDSLPLISSAILWTQRLLCAGAGDAENESNLLNSKAVWSEDRVIDASPGSETEGKTLQGEF